MDLYLEVRKMYCRNTTKRVLNNFETWYRHPSGVPVIPAATVVDPRLW